MQHRLPSRDMQGRGHFIRCLHDIVDEHSGHGGSAIGDQIVEEAGELHLAIDPALHHLGAHAAFAHQQPTGDQLLHGPPHRRPGHPEFSRQGDLVAQQVALTQGAVFDRRLQLLRDLVIQRDGTGPIEVQRQSGHGRSLVIDIDRMS